MKEFNLKNGSPSQIDTWGIGQIKDYLAQEIPTKALNNLGDKSFVGFAFFGPNLARDLMRVDPDNNFSERSKSHRAIVATVDNQAVGIIVTQFVKFSLPFWHYHIRYIDVHQDFKNQGVGTDLTKYLNNEGFLKNKVLFLSMLTSEGSMYIAKVMKKELKAKDYTLVFEDNISKTIKRFGKYGGKYWG